MEVKCCDPNRVSEADIVNLFIPLTNTSTIKFYENSTDYVPYVMRLETYIVPALFAIIFFVGCLGNGTIVFILLKNKAMRTVPNIYIMSLALGDLIVMIGALPFVSTIY